MKTFLKYYRIAVSYTKKYPAEIFGIIAVVLFMASFFNTSYDYDLKREVRQVERHLQKRQRIMEKYAIKALETPPDQWPNLDDMPEDMVLYKYNADTLQSWAHEFPISNDEVDVYPFMYRLQYMSNRNLYNTPLAYIGVKEQYVNLGSAWYVVNTQISKTKQSKVVTGILIKTEYPVDNSSRNKVNPNLKLDKRYTTSSVNMDDGQIVYGLEGSPLFSIGMQGATSFKYGDPLSRWIALVFAIMTLFAYHIKTHSWTSFGVTTIGLVIIRVVTMIMSSRIDTANQVFSPILYADTKLFNSLGSFLFNNLFVSLIVYALFTLRNNILKKMYRLTNAEKKIVVTLLVMLAIFLVAYIHLTLRSLINNSNIILEPFRIEEIGWHSVLCYFSYVLLFLALLFVLQMIVMYIKGERRISLLTWKNIIIYILVISLYCVITVGWFGLKKEFESNRVWTNKLAVERDLSLELQLRSVESAIATDPFIAILSAVDGRELIKNRLMERYFYKSINQKYSIDLTVCTPNNLLELERGAIPVNCFGFYQDQLTRYGVPLAQNSRFFYMNNYSGTTSYIGIFTYFNPNDNQVSRLFIEINAKYVKGAIGYPDALLDIQNYDEQSVPKQYSYAEYSNGRLVSYGGVYNYPVVLGDEYKIGYMMKNKKGYTHFVNKLSDDEVTIVSRPRNSLFQYIVSFSYFAIFFGVFILICTKWGRKSKLFTLPKHSLKRKITLLTTATMIIALVAMGVGSIIYSLRLTEENNNERIEDKIHSAQSSLSEYCKYAVRYNELNTPELFGAMENVSKVIQTDINLYDTHGGLIRSTKPEIFEQFLMGKRMNDKAFREIVYNKALRYTTVEDIMDMNYYSVYAPLFNGDGDLVAIVNVPYFSRSKDVNDATSSTIATIINLYLILLIAAIIVGTTVSNSLAKPLAEIKKKMEGLAMSNKNAHIYYRNKKDELGVLVTAYNNMVDDLEESTRRLAQSEREQAWKEMARQIAHEIKNPLTPMRLSIQHLMRMKKQNYPGWEDKLEELSHSLIEQIDILSDTASEFSSFAKFYNEENADVNLDELIKEQVVIFDNNDNIDFKYVTTTDDAFVTARRKQLARVLVNLISNAIQALENSRGNGHIRISLYKEELPKGNYFKIDIEDDGPGVALNNQNKLFKPNFTTKSGGTGLGLAICRSIVEQSQGMISYKKSSLGGACFSIELPEKDRTISVSDISE